MKVRKKEEIVVEAWLWDESKATLEEIGCGYMGCSGHLDHPDLVQNLRIQEAFEVNNVNKGDYILKFTERGDVYFYVWHEEAFKSTYEIIDNE